MNHSSHDNDQTSLAISTFNSTMPRRIGSPPTTSSILSNAFAINGSSDHKGDERRLPPSFRPSPNAVIIGRGKASYNYTGNKRLMQLVKQNLDSYLNARAMHEKSAMVTMLVNSVKEACPNDGAFVKRKENGVWYEVSDNDARAKVRSLLRPSSQRPSAIFKKKQRSMSASSSISTISSTMSSSEAVVSSTSVDRSNLKVDLPEFLRPKSNSRKRKNSSSNPSSAEKNKKAATTKQQLQSSIGSSAFELEMEPALPLPPSPRQVSLGSCDEASTTSSNDCDDCSITEITNSANVIKTDPIGKNDLCASLSRCIPIMKGEVVEATCSNKNNIPVLRGLLDTLVDIDPVMDPIPLSNNNIGEEVGEDLSYLFFDDTPLDAGIGSRGSSPFDF